MLEIKGLCAGYGEIEVLHDISFSIDAGNIISIVGSNGAGKTTLIRALSGIVKPGKGEIILENSVNLAQLPPDRIVKNGIVQVPEGRQLWSELTVEDNLILGAYTSKARKNRAANFDYVFNIFPRLRERMCQKAGTLSGGEQQMLAIGRALLSEPKLLMLDEPSLGLAPILVEQVFNTVKRINKEGLTILIVEQNVHEALVMSSYGYVLENGRIVKSGGGKELLYDEAIRKAYLGI